MKTNLLFTLSIMLIIGSASAQVYSPIVTTGYTLDAVAENTTALSTTGGMIDGSNYVLYSNAYGLLFGGTATGLPNSGLITNGSRSYQLQSYTAPNMLYVPALTSDSIIFTTPAPYPSLSMLAFATEGTGSMDVKVRFTDGTTQYYTGMSLADWYTGTNTVITGFDRCNRTSGTPNYAGAAGNPRMYYVDLNLTCVNSQKNVEKIVIVNTGNNARLCVMAVSGAAAPTFSAITSPVTCSGGTNGSATVTVTNGVPPFTFTWPGQAAQNSNVGTVLPPGIVSYTITDASGCNFVSTATILQALVPTPPLTVVASATQVCSGNPVILYTSGASTYIWSNNGTTSTTTVSPVTNTVYTVWGTTFDNCTLTGSIAINTVDLPITTFTVPANLCIDAEPLALSALPAGGTFAGGSIIFNSFYANQAGAGTHTLSYTYTDPAGCTSVNTATTIVSTSTTNLSFTITPATLCVGATALTLNAQPAGGTYTGSGVTTTGVFSPALAGLGTRSVSYTYTDANNCTVKKVSSVVVTTCTSVGIEEISGNMSFEMYPNPNNGTFTIKTEAQVSSISIINELGQLVTKVELNSSNNNQVLVENLAPGIYFIQSDNRLLKQKLVVVK